MPDRAEVYKAIDTERRYQDDKFGRNKQQSLPGFILVMENELSEARRAWTKNIEGSRQTPLEEILQVVATGVKCLEVYGMEGSARATDDVTEAKMKEERSQASARRFGAR